jgi:hypothetical protein
MLPGNQTVNQTGAGKGTGMATNAAVHVRGRQDSHRHCSIGGKGKDVSRVPSLVIKGNYLLGRRRARPQKTVKMAAPQYIYPSSRF